MRQQKPSLERLTRWGQLGTPSSHWTTITSNRTLTLLIVGLTVFHWILSGLLPPAEDELYYWSWSRLLAPSYYDHPPMVAWLISASTSVFGDNLFGLRFFSTVFSLGTLLCLRAMTPGPQVLFYLLTTPIFCLGAILMTPDSPLIFFWTVYVIWLSRVNQTFSGWSEDPVTRVYHETPINPLSWIIGGIILGLGCLSKYTMMLAIPCSVAFFFRYRLRAWWKGYALHLTVALLCFLPVLYFNSKHGFASFKYQWEHGFTEEGLSLFRVFEFFGIQSLLVGALPFLMFPWVVLRYRELTRNSTAAACFYFFVLPLVFFVFKSFLSYTEANWPLVAFISFFPLAQWLIEQSTFRYASRWLLLAAFAPATLTTAVLVLHLATPLSIIPPAKDRITRLGEFNKVGKLVASDILENGLDEKVYAPTYQLTALLNFHGVKAEQMNVGRASQFTLSSPNPCAETSAVIFSPSGEKHGLLDCFSSSEPLRDYPLIVRGHPMVTYSLRRYFR